MGIYTPSRETSDPSAPAAGFGSIYLKGASDAAIKAYFEKPNASVLELANTTDANSWAGAQTFNAGAVIAASQALTGTVASSTISGFLSVAATSGIFGTLTAAAGSITDSSGAISFGNENLVTTGTLGAGAITGTSYSGGAISGTTVTGTTAGIFGATPASAGAIRMPNAADINARNAANSADVQVIGISSGNVVFIDASAGGVKMFGGLTVAGLAGVGTRTVVVDANGVMSAP